MAITEFHPLVPPHLDGGREGQWATYSADDGMVYLLNADRYELANLSEVEGDLYKEIHFVTEWDCHNQAAEYYHRQGRVYPYMEEWASVTWDVTGVSEAQSKVMEFI